MGEELEKIIFEINFFSVIFGRQKGGTLVHWKANKNHYSL